MPFKTRVNFLTAVLLRYLELHQIRAKSAQPPVILNIKLCFFENDNITESLLKITDFQRFRKVTQQLSLPNRSWRLSY